MIKKLVVVCAILSLVGTGCVSSTVITPTPTTPPPVVTPPLTDAQKKADLIKVTTDLTGPITSPLTVKGEARGTWFFEASFPVKLLNATGTEIGTGIAKADADWMTESFVPFTVTVTFSAQTAGTHGTLVLHKDNPSGLPSNDNSLTLPVTF